MKDKLLGQFDFAKVKQHMDDVNWTWSGEVPSIYKMIQVVSRMYDSLEKSSDITTISTGGFTLMEHKYHYELCFSIESADVEKV